jgi:hypothetical protein
VGGGGLDSIKMLTYYLKLLPLVGLVAANVVRSIGFSLVSLFGEIATQTCVSIGDFVSASPAIVVW